MAKTKTKKLKMYTLIILNPEGEEVHRRSIPAKQIDEVNFTKQHKIRALMLALSKMP